MITQEEIAKELGVSRQLVSLALAGSRGVAKKTLQRILKTARERGYRLNHGARGQRNIRTGMIALWIPDQPSSFYSLITRKMIQLANRAGTQVIINEVGGSGSIQWSGRLPVDGMIAVDLPAQVDAYDRTVLAGSMPIVSIGTLCSSRTDHVQVDLGAGIRELMKHLLTSGCQRIACATAAQIPGTKDELPSNYQLAMQEAGYAAEYIHCPPNERLRPSARQAVKDFIREQSRPDAILCHSDDVALGVYRGLCDLKLRVPDDVALAGCDGIEDVEYLDPPLTTIEKPVASMCVAAWDFLNKRLAEPGIKTQKMLLASTLAMRESTCRIKNACPREIVVA